MTGPDPAAARVDESEVRAEVRLGPKARDDAFGRCLAAGRDAGEEYAVGAAARREGGDPGGGVKPGHPGWAAHAEPARVRSRSGGSDLDAESPKVRERFRDDPLLARRERHRRVPPGAERGGERLAVVERERGRRRPPVHEEQLRPEGGRLDESRDGDGRRRRGVRHRFQERAVVRPAVVDDAVGAEDPPFGPFDDRPPLFDPGLREDPVDLPPLPRLQAEGVGGDGLAAVSLPLAAATRTVVDDEPGLKTARFERSDVVARRPWTTARPVNDADGETAR